jgi:hypothetical protein
VSKLHGYYSIFFDKKGKHSALVKGGTTGLRQIDENEAMVYSSAERTA